MRSTLMDIQIVLLLAKFGESVLRRGYLQTASPSDRVDGISSGTPEPCRKSRSGIESRTEPVRCRHGERGFREL